MTETFDIDLKKYIHIKDAHLHNLKHIDLIIPKNKLIVITGVSGSGKSTLAFDTLYSEGQRRYVESLSSYARQFLGKLEKPMVEDIKGLVPAIAIQQKVISSNPRSTVGTTSEIYDYLRLLFARIGRTYSPTSQEEVKKHDVSDVIDFIKKHDSNENFLLLSPFENQDKTFKERLKTFKAQGFTRLEINGNIQSVEDLESFGFEPTSEMKVNLVIDRFTNTNDEDALFRFADSVEIAFYEGHGNCFLRKISDNSLHVFSNSFSLDGIDFIVPDIHFFSFNNPLGACPKCEGYGKIIGIDEDLVVPNKNLSVYDDAVACWKGDTMKEWKEMFIRHSQKIDFPIFKPYHELNQKEKDILWNGIGKFPGINGFFDFIEENKYKIQYRILLSRYRGKTTCSQCKGKRLRKETEYVKINQKSINDLIDIPISELQKFFNLVELNDYERSVAKRLLLEINTRLDYLMKVGLSYLTLNRASNTLSGGESQRINLATSLGSSLVGSMYILDEPSIGLHSRDTENLIDVLKQLRNLGNTVIVVEHDEDVMKNADYIIDIGPKAGSLGGKVEFSGTYDELLKSNTLTAQYLNQKREISVPKKLRKPKYFIEIIGARQNNLKNIDVKIPLHCLAVITGVSGSGKSTLMKSILAPYIERKFDIYGNDLGDFNEIKGDFSQIKNFELIDQNPIGKSSRSNPATYIKAYDEIRNLFGNLKESKHFGFTPKHFSFNVDGGRCPECEGEGTVTVSMQFMADIKLICDSCKGKRFKKDVLAVKFNEKNIYDVLEMTIDEAILFFNENNATKISSKLEALQEVGLGYLKLGQSSSTLSGGESQRVKLASYLVKGRMHPSTLFIFDEPSTGLHFYDVEKLIKSFNALIENGHSIIVIEHHLDIIKVADYIIDLGAEAGDKGGDLVVAGTPQEVANCKESITGKYLKEKL
ncbi:MAG: excinuclease ABC subunit UvrA [Flavobacteriales bacterium]|nr:excinuclease ABC subunit UvrA [Flavobacteriales bacterium]